MYVPTHNRRVELWRNLCRSLLYFVSRVRCRRKESSRSLSHLLMSFLFKSVNNSQSYRKSSAQLSSRIGRACFTR